MDRITITPLDKQLLKKLVERKKEMSSVPPEEQNIELSGWGLSFVDLFRDINNSISFSVNGEDVNVHIGEDTLAQGKDLNEGIYLHYNQAIFYEIKVLQRIQLLRQLEENRLIVWANTGKPFANFTFEEQIFYLFQDIDKNYVRNHIKYEAIATCELEEYVKRGFITIDEQQHKESMRLGWFGVFVALFMGIVSFFIH